MDFIVRRGSRVRPKDLSVAARLEQELLDFSARKMRLSGIESRTARITLIEQILESIHRVRFIQLISSRQISPLRTDPKNALFDPLKAAIVSQRNGDIDEACWLIFLFVHFGRSRTGGWRYAREVYGRLDAGPVWSWGRVCADIGGFRVWLQQNQIVLRRKGCGFGNHRKRESLDGASANGTGAVIESYMNWIAPPRTHRELIEQELAKAMGNRHDAFDRLFASLNAVHRFGRLAKFDYLTMLGKLGIADIEPGIPYLRGSTGPLAGARLLFGLNESADNLDLYLAELDKGLRVGMQVLEDSLCNWQKSPEAFKAFRG